MPETRTYKVRAHCDNCGHDFEAAIPFGQRVPSEIECPNCGCPSARQRQPDPKPVWAESKRTWPDRFGPRCTVDARGIFVPRPRPDDFARQAG